ncbi:MAG: LytTR family DNA-binding domain-containing protein [Prolixibacteraceae bacterium]|jgi:DNA-binding LytR/AlgR family response regulator|nr:LytTR family DNA-binding domain-containing protein [Prolixibacteraceae bacterium]
MSKIKALIVDDDISAQRILEKYLQVGDCVEIIDTVSETSSALKLIETCLPDVIFLDINMPEENGLDFAKRLRDNNINTQIVFTTAYKQYAYNAIEVKPIDYLVKPFGLDDVFNVLSKVEQNIRKEEKLSKSKSIWGNSIPDKLKFKTIDGYLFINPREIFCVKSERGITMMFLCDGDIKKINTPVKDLIEMLEPYFFIKINRSSLVNMKFIDSIDRKTHMCILKCGDREERFLMKREVLKSLNDIDAINLG